MTRRFLALILFAASSAAAEPIQIVVVMPKGSAPLTQQVKLLESALGQPQSPVARASSLAEADAVVEFTSYRRLTNDRDPQDCGRCGTSQDFWSGHYLLLHPPTPDKAGPQRFNYMVGDVEDWQVEHVLKMLGRTLGRALELAPASLVKPLSKPRRHPNETD